jgi:hypothetical protein
MRETILWFFFAQIDAWKETDWTFGLHDLPTSFLFTSTAGAI